MRQLADPGTAAALSLIVPGSGQFYIRRPGAALYFFCMALFMWVITFGWGGWIIHILAACHAYSYGMHDCEIAERGFTQSHDQSRNQ